MAGLSFSFEPPDDPLRDEEYPRDDGPDEADEADETLTVPCPHCRREIYEDAVRCPYCENYVVWHHSPWANRRWWWILLGLLGIAAAVLVLMGLARG